MSIISGQDSRVQVGLSSAWKTANRTRKRLPYTTEGFKGTPNYKESEALVGASGLTSMAIVSYKADGAFTSYLPVDLAKLFMYCALGAEGAKIPANGSLGVGHVFKPISSGACANLPSLTVEVDRLLEKAIYLNYKINTWKLSGKAEDYLMFDCDGPAYKEDMQTVIERFISPAGTLATLDITVVPPVGIIVDDDEFNGKICRMTLPNCGQVFYFTIIDTTLATPLLTLRPMTAWGEAAASAPIAASLVGATAEILDWEMAPNVPQSSLEYLRFVHGYLYMDEAVGTYKALGTGSGKTSDTAVDVPTTLTGAAGLEIKIAAMDPLTLVERVYVYGGAEITRATTILEFLTTPGATADKIQAIFDANGALHANWTVLENTYDEITEFTLSGDNKVSDGLFGMNGSMFQTEVNPTIRDFNLDVTSRFTSRMSQLRVKRMQAGVPCHIKLVFVTTIADGPMGSQNTSVDSANRPYRMEVNMPKAYYVDGVPNISGADEPTISPKFRLAEDTAAGKKAVEVTIYDDVDELVASQTWNPIAREDGYAG